MNKVAEIVLTALLLLGMYCAIPTSFAQGDPVIRVKQAVLLADGSDPMPLCRTCRKN